MKFVLSLGGVLSDEETKEIRMFSHFFCRFVVILFIEQVWDVVWLSITYPYVYNR